MSRAHDGTCLGKLAWSKRDVSTNGLGSLQKSTCWDSCIRKESVHDDDDDDDGRRTCAEPKRLQLLSYSLASCHISLFALAADVSLGVDFCRGSMFEDDSNYIDLCSCELWVSSWLVKR